MNRGGGDKQEICMYVYEEGSRVCIALVSIPLALNFVVIDFWEFLLLWLLECTLFKKKILI